nr:hypothetical protein [Tanacetum cinerariifolium]
VNEAHVVAEELDDVVECCVKNTTEAWTKEFVASFHGTNCRDVLQRFRIRSGKVRLANEKTLDISGFRDVVLKTSLGTSWTLVVAHGNKRRRLDMVKVHSNRINATINGRCIANLHERLGHMSENGMKIIVLKSKIPDLHKADIGLCKLCVLGKHKKTFYSVFQKRNNKGRKLRTLEGTKGHKFIKRRDATFNKDSIYRAKAATEAQVRAQIQVKGTKGVGAPTILEVNYLLLTEYGELESYLEALGSKEFVELKKDINEEMCMILSQRKFAMIIPGTLFIREPRGWFTVFTSTRPDISYAVK